VIKNRLAAAIATATALALLGTACSAGTGSGTPGPDVATEGIATDGGTRQSATPDPCSLLTLDEVSTVLGRPFTLRMEPPVVDPSGRRSCSFFTSTDSAGLVSVIVSPFEDRARFERLEAVSHNVTHIAGVGETAYAGPQNIWVYQAGWMITIAVGALELTSTDPLATLAKSAVGRMPA